MLSVWLDLSSRSEDEREGHWETAGIDGASPVPVSPQWGSLAHRLRKNCDSLPALLGLTAEVLFSPRGLVLVGLPRGGPYLVGGKFPLPDFSLSLALRIPFFPVSGFCSICKGAQMVPYLIN